MKYKLIACDLDETLLSTNKKVSPKNRQAIAQASRMGVKFVVSTGRPFNSIQGTLKELDLYQKPGEFSLVLNGAESFENDQDEPMYSFGIPYEKVEMIYNASLQWKTGIHIYTENEVYVWNIDEDERNFLKGRMDVIEVDDPDISFLKTVPVIKALLVSTDRPYLESIDEALKDQTRDMEISYSSNRYLEFNRLGINKGSGLKALAEKLDIPLEEVIAVGDNVNDLAMIKEAGLGIGVANSDASIIPFCQHLTQADHNHDAIAELIETFILPQEQAL